MSRSSNQNQDSGKWDYRRYGLNDDPSVTDELEEYISSLNAPDAFSDHYDRDRPSDVFITNTDDGIYERYVNKEAYNNLTDDERIAINISNRTINRNHKEYR